MGRIAEIYIAEAGAAPMQQHAQVELIAGKGIVGDRYFNGNGTWSDRFTGLPDREITLVEAEKLQAFNRQFNLQLGFGEFRRNVVTEGVDLNALVDREFSVGDTRLRGIRLCEPCAYLAEQLTPEVLPALVHLAGLRAQILQDAVIRDNDPITV